MVKNKKQKEIINQKKKELAKKNGHNTFYICAGVRTDLDRLETEAAKNNQGHYSFRQFAAVWQTFQFHTITNGYPKRNDLYDYYKIADYCQRDFIEELNFILVERLVADAREKINPFRTIIRLFTLFGVFELTKGSGIILIT